MTSKPDYQELRREGYRLRLMGMGYLRIIWTLYRKHTRD